MVSLASDGSGPSCAMSCASAWRSRSASAPRATPRSAAASMPSAIASPWRKRRYFVTASSACPMVWPKFRMRRSPPSRSSADTTSALMRHDSTMAGNEHVGIAREDRLRVLRDAIEQPAARDHAVFHDLVQARAELAARQRAEHQRIDRDHRRLVEGANQVLAERVIDADLSADRAVHLREQRRRHVRQRDAAQERGRRKARGIANHAAAHGDDRAAAIGARANQRVVDARDRLQVLVALAVGMRIGSPPPRMRCSCSP